MADVAAAYGVTAAPRPGYPGTWVDADGPRPRKLGALGLRVERGITFHGIALNITTRLADFGLIDPCGMAGLDVTSIARELGWHGRGGGAVDRAWSRRPADRFAAAFAAAPGERGHATLPAWAGQPAPRPATAAAAGVGA